MNQKQIEKARLSLHHAGTPLDHNQLGSRLVAELTNDIAALEEKARAIQQDFRRRLERWRTEEVPEDVSVCAISTDIHDSRLYRLTGVFALLSEMGLAAWVFGRLGVPSLIGAIIAVCITFTLHGIFLHIFNDPERPKQTVHRLRCMASLPAIFGFLIALALCVLARYVAGTLALLLLPLFSFALWLGTLSLLVLAASLFTLAHILSWSARYEREYQRLYAQLRASSDFLKELQPGSDIRTARPRAMLPSHTDSRPFDGRSTALPVIALVAVALAFAGGTGCTPPISSAEAPTTPVSAEASTRPTARPAASLHIYIDWSGSCVRPALEESWNTIKQELPTLGEKCRTGAISVWRFDEDGWCPQLLRELPLPVFELPERSDVQNNEWDTFSNVRDALRAEGDRKWQAARKAAEDHYRAALCHAVRDLDSAGLLPGPDQESHNTDIAGLLRRLSQTRESAPQFIILLTDLADTRVRTLSQMPQPAGETHVLVLLMPAQEKDALLTIGKPLSSSEQFDFRSRQLHESAPWIAVAPYFAHNLAALFESHRN